MMTNIVLALFFGWCMVLSYVVYRMQKHYQRLTTFTKKEQIDEILEALISKNQSVNAQQEVIKKELSVVHQELRQSFHKIGLVKFNAFDKMQGEQSFVLALLNELKNGIVLNFIYTHEGIRVYTKKVKQGVGQEYELSAEEKEAVQKAE